MFGKTLQGSPALFDSSMLSDIAGLKLRMLNGLLFALAVVIGLFLIGSLIFNPVDTVLAGMTLIGVLLPAYILGRMGHLEIATCYLGTTYAIGISIAYFSDLICCQRIPMMLNYVDALMFTLILSAVMISARASVLMAILNCALIIGLYVMGKIAQPLVFGNDTLLSLLIAPILNQIFVELICYPLTRSMKHLYRKLQETIAISERQVQEFKGILEALPVGVGVYDVEAQELTFCNKQLIELIGTPTVSAYATLRRESFELEEGSLQKADPGEELPWRWAANTGQFGTTRYAKVTHADNRLFSIEEHLTPIYGSKNKLKRVVYTAADISLNRKLQSETELMLNIRREESIDRGKIAEHLRQLDELKSEFMATMSHELKTPLNVIISYADVILNDKKHPPEPQLAQDVGRINTAATLLLNIFNSILDASKLDAGQLQLHRTLLDVRSPIRSSMATLQGEADKRKLGLHATLPEVSVMLCADSTRLEQVLINLLSNALKFTPAGSVHITLTVTDAQALVAIQDTGIGIASEQHEAIFERFFKLGDVASSNRSGTGLGLTISRVLIELHGGKLWVQSTPGQGSTFTFSLPLVAC